MKIKLPLYAKILFWFFLNMVFLGVIFLVFARGQFRFGLESLINGPAGRNLDNVIQYMSAELRDNPGSEWGGALARVSEPYGVKFYLFRGRDQVGGTKVDLPAEVRAKMPDRRPGANPPPRRGPDGGPDGPDGPPDGPPAGLPGRSPSCL